MPGSAWSLPTVKELRRFIPEHLYNYYNNVANEYIESFGFEDVGGVVWTQTPRGSGAWFVRLGNGYATWLDQGGTDRAVCSRWNN